MARQVSAAVENNFVMGLITETTALRFPPNACTETFNCVFDSTGRVTRRLGVDLEPDYALESITSPEDEAIVEYQWSAVAGNGNINFQVVQKGNTILFYDVSTEGSVSPNLKSFTLTLTDFLPASSGRDPSPYPCAFTQGNGKLIIVNEATDPVVVTYSPISDAITTETVTLRFRDFQGVDDGLDLIERPTNTVANLKTDNPEHYYNLLNQGWHATDALSQWDSARTDMPSNADIFQMYRQSETDAFDNAEVTAKSPGNTPAPKGHFILEVANVDRTTAMIDEGFTGAALGINYSLISSGAGTIIVNTSMNIPGDPGIGNGALAFNDITNSASAACMVSASDSNLVMVGKDWDTATEITQAIIYGSNDNGFQVGSNVSITASLYGKQGSFPSTTTDGTLLGSTTFTDTSNESAGRTITSSDVTTQWDYTWVRISSSTTTAWRWAEVQFYANDPLTSTERPNTTAFFAGRSWFAGIKGNDLNSSIYFSQIIESDDQYGKCYQANDPTAEDNAQLLPTDGGVIKIPEIGQVTKLFPTQNSILVFATNGVWLIGGGDGGAFDATNYQVSRLSNIGTSSAQSFVDIQGIPFWWAESDIYTAQYDPNYNSYKVVPVTEQSIQTFIRAIPEASRRLAKGAYNLDLGLAIWLYNSTSTDQYQYDTALIFDTASQAFYPWRIEEHPNVVIRGVSTIVVADGTAEPKTVLTVTINNDNLTFAAAYQTTYKDWGSVATLFDDEDLEIDYESYFVTGYRIDGQAYRQFQSNYVWVYMETEENASCFMRGQFDFSNSGNSGKWSTSQQLYNSDQLHRDVRHRRLKVRGKGKSLQLRFYSETGKPFTIIGWVIWETSNAAA